MALCNSYYKLKGSLHTALCCVVQVYNIQRWSTYGPVQSILQHAEVACRTSLHQLQLSIWPVTSSVQMSSLSTLHVEPFWAACICTTFGYLCYSQACLDGADLQRKCVTPDG